MVAQRWNAGLAIERAQVRIIIPLLPCRSIHDAPVHSAAKILAIKDSGGTIEGLVFARKCYVVRILPRDVDLESERSRSARVG